MDSKNSSKTKEASKPILKKGIQTSAKKDSAFDWRKMFVIFIAAIMVSSIIGFSFLNGGTPPVPPGPPITDDTQEQIFSYTAEPVEGTLDKILTSARIGFPAEVLEIDELNSKLSKVAGIKRIDSSSFRKEQETGNFFYVADIITDEDFNASSLISEVKKDLNVTEVVLLRKA